MSIQAAATGVQPNSRAAPAAPLAAETSRNIGDLLALSFGTSIAMWALGYVGHMPFTGLPSSLFVGLMMACLVVGGFLTTRHTRRGVGGAALVGLFSGLLTLCILMPKLTSQPHDFQPAELVPHAWLYIPCFFALQIILATVGGAIGVLFPGRIDIRWPAVLGIVAAASTLVLITAGGLVTGFKAGLAVPDWPNSYTSNMVLFPLKRMIEMPGRYFEHVHRLLGMLVGFTSLTLAIFLTVTDKRRALRFAVWGVFGAVCLQGLLGGLRVTGKLTESTTDVAPNDTLALVHGFFAHVVLAGFVIVAVMCCKSYVAPGAAEPRPSAGLDRLLTRFLVIGILIQTFIGGFVRHFDLELMLHITVAALVSALALAVATRAWLLNRNAGVPPADGQQISAGQPILRRLGVVILLILLAQIVLGILALIVRTPGVSNPSATTAILTTLHQANAAMLLASAVALAMWTQRLLRPVPYLSPSIVISPAQ